MSQATLATSAQTRVIVNSNYVGRSRIGRTGTTLKTVGRFLAVTLDGDVESALYLPSELDQIAPTQTVSPAVTPPTVAPQRLATTALRTARTIAVELTKQKPWITSDDVQAELVKRGYKTLGNAAGTLFKGNNWTAVGAVASTRPEARGRTIKQWQYVR